MKLCHVGAVVGTKGGFAVGVTKPEYKRDSGFLEHLRLSPRPCLPCSAPPRILRRGAPRRRRDPGEDYGAACTHDAAVAMRPIVRSPPRFAPSGRHGSASAAVGWLAADNCTHVAMEATGLYWKPLWHILDHGNSS
jgi:hypothetical protein